MITAIAVGFLTVYSSFYLLTCGMQKDGYLLFLLCTEKEQYYNTVTYPPSERSTTGSSDLAMFVTFDPVRKAAIKQFPALYYQKITQAP